MSDNINLTTEDLEAQMAALKESLRVKKLQDSIAAKLEKDKMLKDIKLKEKQAKEEERLAKVKELQDNFSFFGNLSDRFEYFLAENNIVRDPNVGYKCPGVYPGTYNARSLDELAAIFIEDVESYNASIPEIPGPRGGMQKVYPSLNSSKDRIKTCISAYETRMQDIRLANLQGMMLTNESLSKEARQQKLDEYVDKLAKMMFFDNVLDKCMFKHMLYSIKRRVFKRHVMNEILYSFYSAGGGWFKTQLAFRLIADDSFRSDCDPESLSDKREYTTMSRDSFVMLFDDFETNNDAATGNEASNLRRMIGFLRSVITSPRVTSRVMATHTKSVHEKLATLITTGNSPFTELIPDESGGRRFWTFKMETPQFSGNDYFGHNPEKAKELMAHLEELKNIYQYIDIDDNGEGYYYANTPYYHEIVAEQMKRSHFSILDDYIQQQELVLARNKKDTDTLVQIVDITDSFNNWRENTRNEKYAWSVSTMFKKLTAQGYYCTKLKGIDYVGILDEGKTKLISDKDFNAESNLPELNNVEIDLAALKAQADMD